MTDSLKDYLVIVKGRVAELRRTQDYPEIEEALRDLELKLVLLEDRVTDENQFRTSLREMESALSSMVRKARAKAEKKKEKEAKWRLGK